MEKKMAGNRNPYVQRSISQTSPQSPYKKGLQMRHLGQAMMSFAVGFAESFRGAIELFTLDARMVQNQQEQIIQRNVQKERLLNRESPARDLENFAKKRALERRAAAAAASKANSSKSSSTTSLNTIAENSDLISSKSPRILNRTLKCCAWNIGVFLASIVLFNNLIKPTIQGVLYAIFGSSSRASIVPGEQNLGEKLWTYTGPALSVTFSTLWVLPVFFITKVVNAIWFQDIADSAFKSSRSRAQRMSSVSVMIADTIFTVVIETIFLVQGQIFSLFPIESLGYLVNMVHLCLLHSLYCFEYKWFNQGLELHKRLTYIEHNWPYFLGFGLPLAVITSYPNDFVISGCVFSAVFPLFIVSANQAQHSGGNFDISVPIFHPTIAISDHIFQRMSL